ncbi:MAG TPA: DUF4136 domain-containing protein [Gemmatimonadales bacterium]|nr:DUF4136 domain-containing protein [Gemmatimonadales bacterium]
MSVRALFVVLGLLLAAACGGGLTARTDVDPAMMPRTAAWKTWAWLPVPGGTDRREAAPLADLVTRDIESALAARGFPRVDVSPDFLVGWHAALTGPLDVNDVSGYYGYTYGKWYPGGGIRYSPRYLLEYPEGTVLVDIVDGPSRELIWRGRTVVDAGKLRDPIERDRVVAEAVAAILTQFRPEPGR